jgi:hypothetical protein
MISYAVESCIGGSRGSNRFLLGQFGALDFVSSAIWAHVGYKILSALNGPERTTFVATLWFQDETKCHVLICHIFKKLAQCGGFSPVFSAQNPVCDRVPMQQTL